MDPSRFYPPSLLQTACPSWTAHQYFEVAESLTETCLSHYERHGAHHPIGTLYCGSLGPCVYLRYRLAKYLLNTDKKKAEKLLRDALVVAEAALCQEEERPNVARRMHRVSLLEGTWVGAKVLQCAILHYLGASDDVTDEINDLLLFLREACRALPTTESEVLYGRAGALQAILFLRQELQNASTGSEVVVKLASDIVKAGVECSKRTLPLLWEWHGKAYLGAAHGVVGILQMLLSLQSNELNAIDQQVNGSVRHLIRRTIDGLEEGLCFPSGNLQSSVGSDRDKLVHWCHGATGHVMLLTKASKVFQDAAYLERAKVSGENVLMQRGLLRKGVGLCHGISGNAYALLSIGRASNDEIWIQRAKLFAHFALHHFGELEGVPDRPYSLYEGCAGLGALLLDLCDPGDSAFPLYEFL